MTERVEISVDPDRTTGVVGGSCPECQRFALGPPARVEPIGPGPIDIPVMVGSVPCPVDGMPIAMFLVGVVPDGWSTLPTGAELDPDHGHHVLPFTAEPDRAELRPSPPEDLEGGGGPSP